MKKPNVDITVSETFSGGSVQDCEEILNDTINEWLEGHRIINVQLVEKNGLLRFWIYHAKEV